MQLCTRAHKITEALHAAPDAHRRRGVCGAAWCVPEALAPYAHLVSSPSASGNEVIWLQQSASCDSPRSWPSSSGTVVSRFLSTNSPCSLDSLPSSGGSSGELRNLPAHHLLESRAKIRSDDVLHFGGQPMRAITRPFRPVLAVQLLEQRYIFSLCSF